MIRVYEVRRREASVRATRLFLSEQRIRRLRSYVPQALAGVDIC